MPDDGIAAGQRLTLQEYEDNDFIRGLPPIRSTKEAYRTLHAPPIFDVSEREMAMELRRHCVLRLKRYYEPLPMHIDLAAKIEMLVYQGYVGRNPGHGGHARQLLRTPDAVKAGPLPGPAMSAGKTAGGMALVGCSGIGKSNLVEKIHAQYEPVISHSARFRCEQVPFVKLDCPHNGSEAVLCDSFFIYLDNLLGTDFHKRYGGDKRTVGGKLLAMAQLAVRHAVGVIVIDEIQHLVSTRERTSAEVPGDAREHHRSADNAGRNTRGYPLFQGTFRQARRVSGFGSVVWDRMPQDDTWRHFARRLWAINGPASPRRGPRR